MMINLENLQNKTEAILFASGGPLEILTICKTLDISKDEFLQVFSLLEKRYEDTALEIKILGESCQMMTKQEYSPGIEAVLMQKTGTVLSPAALEVLSVIAYNEPVTRAFVEEVRGVDSSA